MMGPENDEHGRGGRRAGRPPVGPPVLIRFPAQLRGRVEADARPGESFAAAVRRLVDEALSGRGR